MSNVCTNGKNPKTNGLQQKDKKPLKSIANRIRTFFVSPKNSALIHEQKIAPSDAIRTLLDKTRQCRHYLEERMDPDFGLLDTVHANGIIDWREMEDVTSQSSSCKRNSKLLDYILQKDQCHGLVMALLDADQMHIVNYLRANGEYSDEFGHCWPLTSKEISILVANHRSLVDLLDLTDLLDLLYSTKVINSGQKDLIYSKPTLHEKNNTLLGILRRRSFRDYRQLIASLHASNQSHIAELLECGGAVVRIHSNQDGENVDEAEDEIVSQIADILIGKSIDEKSRILERVNLRVIAAKKVQSIVLYIYCKTIEDLQQLHESLIGGELKDSVELWFNSLLIRSGKITVEAINQSNEEIQKMRTYFKEQVSGLRCQKSKHSSDTEVTENLPKKRRMASATETDCCQPSMTTLKELPFELLDAVLVKSLLHWMLHASHNLRDEDVIKALASVDFCWFQRTTRRRFKKRIWQKLRDFYGKTRKSCAIIRNNRNYLLDNIDSNYQLISSLLCFNCLTEEQSRIVQRQRLTCTVAKTNEKIHFIQRQRSTREKNSELLSAMRSLDETQFSNLVKCLRRAKQKAVAMIMENGGGVIRVDLQNRATKFPTSRETQIVYHRKIEELRSRTEPRSHEAEKVISHLKEKGVEIMNSHLDNHTLVVWLWCRSQAALEYTGKLYESTQLTDVLLGVEYVHLSTPEIDQSRVLSIDCSQFKKAVVACPISINFTQRFKIGIYEYVYGVTKLQDKIYVLCQQRSNPASLNVIRVFEDLNPIRLQKEIKITEIKDPEDIVSSEEGNCLYVAEFYKKCILKITRETDDQHKIMKWLTTDYIPCSLSVSSNGQLLVVSRSSPILWIYASDAELIRYIQLPEGICNLRHAVETSIGNLIINHEEEVEERVEESEGDNVSSVRKRRKKKRQFAISELTSDGQLVIRSFTPSNEAQQMNESCYLSLDSDDRVFVADKGNDRVILLDSDLKWNRVLCPTIEETDETRIQGPFRMCYDDDKKQLIVGGDETVNVYSLSWT